MVKEIEKLKKTKKNNQGEGGGRPPKMTEAILKKLLDCFSVGASDEEACMYADITPATLYNYQKKHKKFLEQKEYLKNHSIKLQAKLNIRQSIMDYQNVGDSWKRLEKKDPEFKSNNTADIDISDGDKKISIKVKLPE